MDSPDLRQSRENRLRGKCQPETDKKESLAREDSSSDKSEKRDVLTRKESVRESKSEPECERRVNFLDVEKPAGPEKRESLRDIGNKGEIVQKKFISTWKLACDKTRDRTKELLKKWRTLPNGGIDPNMAQTPQPNPHRWSVHVWTTWVKRFPSEDDTLSLEDTSEKLTPTQKEKLTHFFSHIFDTDRDEVISLQDFEAFTERVRHFTDWTTNSGEYLILQQVQQGFVQAFLAPSKLDKNSEDSMAVDMYKQFLSLEDWLKMWSRLLLGIKNMQELPIWLQFFPKVIFQAINKSGSGRISRDELSAFYSSVMGFSAQRVGEIIDEAYKAMTANGDCMLTYAVYRLCFANFLLGRFPNGPGQYVFGSVTPSLGSFPVDYSAMNTAPEDREQYTPDKKTNRRSIIV